MATSNISKASLSSYLGSFNISEAGRRLRKVDTWEKGFLMKYQYVAGVNDAYEDNKEWCRRIIDGMITRRYAKIKQLRELEEASQYKLL